MSKEEWNAVMLQFKQHAVYNMQRDQSFTGNGSVYLKAIEMILNNICRNAAECKDLLEKINGVADNKFFCWWDELESFMEDEYNFRVELHEQY